MLKLSLKLFSGVIILFGLIQIVSAQQTETVHQGELPKTEIILVLDNSGSMKQNDPQFLTKKVVADFVDGLGEGARLAMVLFDEKALLVKPLSRVNTAADKSEFLKTLQTINYQGQYTNSPDAIERAVYELKTKSREDARKVIIFLTDGLVDTGDKSRDIEKEKWLKEDLALESSKAGIKIFGIAFTDKADFLLIQTLAIKTGGEYFRAYQAKDIKGIFEKIYRLITQTPKSPENLKSEIGKVDNEQPKETKPEVGVSEAKPGASKPAEAKTPPAAKQKSISTPLIIAGAVVFLSIIILFFVLKGKSKQEEKTSGFEAPFSMPKAELIDIKSVISKESIKIVKPKVDIGRAAKRGVTIPEDTISDLHASIEFKEDGFYIEDQRSTNGTYLGGKKIDPNKPIKLKSGDTIRFDVYEFRFVLPDDGQAGETVLAVKAHQESGTVLRPPKPDKGASPKEAGPSTKSAEDQPPQQENETRIKPGMCPNHPARKATELCPVCKNAFCKQCTTQKDGKEICKDCAGKDQ